MNNDIFGYVTIFGLFSTIGLVLAVLLFGVNNDLVIGEIYNASSQIKDSGLITEEVFESIEESANQYSQLIDYFDWYWLLFYVLFVGGSITASYYSKQEDEFSFLTMLFYGTMLFLFLFSIFTVLTDWFSTEVLYNLLPNLQGAFPMFDTWLNSAGIITLIHLLFCMVASKIDLKLSAGRTKKGEQFTDTNEVL